MKYCIFCQIAKHLSPAHIISENKEFMAFLDIYPPTFKGKITSPNIVVITKKHYKSNPFEDLPENVYQRILLFSRSVSRKVQKNLKPLRVCLIIEGMEINHFHIKLYPIFKKYYPGYLSTIKGINNTETLAKKEFLEKIKRKILK